MVTVRDPVFTLFKNPTKNKTSNILKRSVVAGTIGFVDLGDVVACIAVSPPALVSEVAVISPQSFNCECGEQIHCASKFSLGHDDTDFGSAWSAIYLRAILNLHVSNYSNDAVESLMESEVEP